MKKVVYFLTSVISLSMTMLMASCGNTDEPTNPNKGGGSIENVQYETPSDGFRVWDVENGVVKIPEEYRFRDLARAITALNLDQVICQEVHDAVSKSVECGLDEVYYLKEAIGGGTKICSETRFTRFIYDKLSRFNDNNAVKYINEYWTNTSDQDRLQIYWPYSENWDGVTTPIVACQYQGYVIAENGQIIEGITFVEEYAKTHPVWIINLSPVNYSELPDFGKCNYVKEGNNTIVYHSLTTSESEDYKSSKYLTENDKDDYFEKKATTTYSLYIKDVASVMETNELPDGGQYYFVTVLDIEGENLRNVADLETYNPRYVTHRFCLLRSQINAYESSKEMQNVDMLLCGNFQPSLISLPSSSGQIAGPIQEWNDECQLMIFDLDNDSQRVSRNFMFPENIDVDILLQSQAYLYRRPGSAMGDYDDEKLFTDVVYQNATLAFTLGYVEGGTIPDWLK